MPKLSELTSAYIYFFRQYLLFLIDFRSSSFFFLLLLQPVHLPADLGH